ncbi:hypothetical protein JYT53_00990 [Cytophagaceae bacterium AH-315-L13]|nr:hypothetical protein [Cytophagaceae bacterium AH-315-L13]
MVEIIAKQWVFVKTTLYLITLMLLNLTIQGSNSNNIQLFKLDNTKLAEEFGELNELEKFIDREFESCSSDSIAILKANKITTIDSAYFKLGQEDADMFYGNSEVFIMGMFIGGILPFISGVYGCASGRYEVAMCCGGIMGLFPVMGYPFHVKDLSFRMTIDPIVAKTFKDNPGYYRGYEYKAKQIRTRIARIGSWVGYVASIAGVILTISTVDDLW